MQKQDFIFHFETKNNIKLATIISLLQSALLFDFFINQRNELKKIFKQCAQC